MEYQEGNAEPGAHVSGLAKVVLAELAKVIRDQTETLELMVACLLSPMHTLLEGVPGTGKTLMTKALAAATHHDFRRIQFTPDLLPSDILGTNVFDVQAQEFTFRKGPIFTQILLADEINRTPPKTQAALLEAMEERQVTIDGTTYPLPDNFTVFATQNPLEYEGTYPLPEAQLDRFAMCIRISYSTAEEEQKLLKQHHEQPDFIYRLNEIIEPVAQVAATGLIYDEINAIHVEDSVFDYIFRLVEATRNHPLIFLGASPRAGITLLKVGKTLAAMRGKTYLTPDEIIDVAASVLAHRIILTPEGDMQDIGKPELISQVFSNIPVPR
jgi:MoxR-like ATPase